MLGRPDKAAQLFLELVGQRRDRRAVDVDHRGEDAPGAASRFSTRLPCRFIIAILGLISAKSRRRGDLARCNDRRWRMPCRGRCR
jgi:hypothetical protein